MPDRPFRWRALGRPALLVGGDERPLGLRRAVALVAYLAEAGRPVARDAIAELLWPEQPGDLARTRLRRLLHRIAERVGDGLIVADQACVAAAPGLAAGSDAGAFRAAASGALASGRRDDLEEAARRIGPPFLEGLALDDMPELEAWAAGVRLELERLAARVLRRVAERRAEDGDFEQALDAAERLLALDPHRETTHRLVLRLTARAVGEDAALIRYREIAERLQADLGTRPSPRTDARAAAIAAAVEPAPATLPRVRYVDEAGGAIAYAVVGDRGPAVVIAPGFVSHIEMAWEDPPLRDFLLRLARGRRVVIFDRRGQGLSERMGVRQSIDQTALDIRAIARAEKLERVAIFGASEGAPSAIRAAHRWPALVDRLILFGAPAKGTWSEDYPHMLRAEQFETWRRRLVADWGAPASIELFAPSRAAEPAFRAWWARTLRHAATPASVGSVLSALKELDVRSLLPELRAPALVLHRRGDRAIRIGAGHALAAAIPGARFVELDGEDHWWWCGDVEPVFDALDRFLPAAPSFPDGDER